MNSARWQTILVVINQPLASDQPALHKAAAIARRCGARLLLFNSFMLPQPVADASAVSRAEIVAATVRYRRTLLQGLARKFRAGKATCIVHWDYPPHEAIVRQALRSNADLVITDSHRQGRLARLLLSNTDWELMRTCPCPMWFVRSGSLPKSTSVLVAVDPRHTHAKPADLDDRLLQTAAALTDQLGGRINIVHAYEATTDIKPGLLRRPLLPRPPSAATRALAERTSAQVLELGDDYGIPAARCSVRAGDARDVIAAETRRAATEVLVMGAVSRNPAVAPVIGSTAETLIDRVTCDVLVVKPRGFRTPVRRRIVRA